MLWSRPRARKTSGEENRETVIGAASRLVARGRLEEAIELQYRVLDERPSVRLVNLTGDLLVRADRVPAAVELFLRVAEHYRRHGFWDKAKAVYRKVLRHDPLCKPAIGGLARIDAESVSVGRESIEPRSERPAPVTTC